MSRLKRRRSVARVYNPSSVNRNPSTLGQETPPNEQLGSPVYGSRAVPAAGIKPDDILLAITGKNVRLSPSTGGLCLRERPGRQLRCACGAVRTDSDGLLKTDEESSGLQALANSLDFANSRMPELGLSGSTSQRLFFIPFLICDGLEALSSALCSTTSSYSGPPFEVGDAIYELIDTWWLASLDFESS